MDLLFVYGTLKRKLWAHERMSGAKYLRDVVTAEPRWACVEFLSDFYKGRTYPAVVAGGTALIKGELYQIPSNLWPDLDTFEEEGLRYRRELILCDQNVQAYIYLNMDTKSPVTHVSDNIIYDAKTNVYEWLPKI